MFKILNVSLVVDDLSARARIREAAIQRFAASGFGASVRAIAADAGVSPALIIHHFGSKDALIAACHEHVLADALRLKSGVLDGSDASLFAGVPGGFAAFELPQAYLVQALLAGGATARAIIEATVAASERALASAVASGVMRPSHDPAARARLMAFIALGAAVVATLDVVHSNDGAANNDGDVNSDGDAVWKQASATLLSLSGEYLDLLTQGLLTKQAGEALRAALNR